MAHQFFFNPFILDNLPAPATGFDVVQDLSEPRLRMGNKNVLCAQTCAWSGQADNYWKLSGH